MIKDMRDAPRDGTHFLALERVGLDGTSDEVLEWREIWYRPRKSLFGDVSPWTSEAGDAQFGAECFAGWIDLPPKQ